MYIVCICNLQTMKVGTAKPFGSSLHARCDRHVPQYRQRTLRINCYAERPKVCLSLVPISVTSSALASRIAHQCWSATDEDVTVQAVDRWLRPVLVGGAALLAACMTQAQQPAWAELEVTVGYHLNLLSEM